MIGNHEAVHPTSDRLAAFALGRLDHSEAAAVADHLGGCESCQQTIRAVPDDSMLALLRPGGSTPLPQREGLTSCDDAAPAVLRGHARYQVLRRLGAGGMGVVYQCEHRHMGRTVALKVINKELIAAAGVVERFQREVRAAARLAHPNLVQAFDAEKAGDLHFLVLEFIEGLTLETLVQRDGPLPVDRACDYVRQAALGLAHAAAQGLVHRDVKPQNIMATPQGQVKVMDFGLAGISAERGGEGGLTDLGQGLGTPDYVAPEQIRDAHAADARADIYSLGGTFYFLLTGRAPFPKGNSAQKVAAHLEQQPAPLSGLRPEVPAGLLQVIDKMMAKDPAQRYQTAAAVVAALEPWCHPGARTGDRPRRLHAVWRLFRRPRTVAIAGGAALVLVAAALTDLVLRGSEPPKREQPPEVGLPSKPADPDVQAGDTPPDLSQVMPLIDDDFSDPDKSHFPTVQDNGIESRFEKGRYVVQKPRMPAGCRLRPDYAAVDGDIACQVVGRALPGGADSGWGMSLATLEDRHLAIKVRNDGAVVVCTFVWGPNTVTTWLGQPIWPPGVGLGDKPDTLLVVLRGGQRLENYVNGAAICRPIQLEQPLAPRVDAGIMSWSLHAEFTRFTLWQLPPAQANP